MVMFIHQTSVHNTSSLIFDFNLKNLSILYGLYMFYRQSANKQCSKGNFWELGGEWKDAKQFWMEYISMILNFKKMEKQCGSLFSISVCLLILDSSRKADVGCCDNFGHVLNICFFKVIPVSSHFVKYVCSLVPYLQN